METCRAVGIDGDSEGAFVAAAKVGDPQAFEKLVLRYKTRVFATALRITNNREDAEDVVQDSFHKVFLHLGKFQEKSKFSTWLTRIVMNEAFILLRRRRGVSEPLLTESPDNDAKSPSDLLLDRGPSPEQSCWQRERTKLLAEAINHLGPKIRRTVLLCNIEERSIEETAQILGTSRGAVKSRLFQGYKKLRRTLNPRLLRGVNAVSRAEAHRTFVGNVAF